LSASPTSLNNIFENYSPPAEVYDEYFEAQQEVRAHSSTFVDAINRVGRDELVRRWQRAGQTVHENGFAYGGYSKPGEQPRPWELDALPLVISSAEWALVSAALKQRAVLLNMVLRDLYGEQSLLKSGILPAELVYSHPGFLRPYHGQQMQQQDCFLHFYAADLARSPEGNWWVLADRTEAPSGLGFALENRVVISRMLPDVFGQCQVQRLAPFFIAAQETMRSLAPQRRENPRVVLLSRGPTSRNYFEDAYLARYMGYTLAEGGDLAIRKSQVMLKTLGGLLPVDVIMRRQNSSECDPLELAPRSAIGVSGLMQAARVGNVGIANSLGSGLVESPAFMSFMPRLCEELLGDNLLMPGVATWWCGEADGREYVLKNLERLNVYPAFRQRGGDSQTHKMLSELSLPELAAKIRENPLGYSAQEKVVRSTSPVWNRNLQPAHVALRAYAVASSDSYTVMQGALARVSWSLEPLETSIRKGEGSKDVWVLSDGPVEHVSLLEEPGSTIVLRRSGAELPSRVADNTFWLGRQLERAEAAARLLRSTVSRMCGETRSTGDLELPILLRCLADQGQIEPGYAVAAMRRQLPPIEQTLPEWVFDSTQPASLRSVLNELFRLGSILRDRTSLDTWRIILRIDEGFRPASDGKNDLADLLAMTDELITKIAAFNGVIMDSMTRGHSYRFLDLGRRVERSLQIISLIETCFIPLPEVQRPVLETILEVANSLMTYRSRYLANLQLPAVLDLLLTDESNPRSLAFQFVQLAEHVEQLPRNQATPGHSAEQRYAMTLLHSVRMVDPHRLCEEGTLLRLIAKWETLLPKLSEAISHRYLVHSVSEHQLAEIRPQ
jgi:uncharacterized circularly permuted ATP-grasp superfamily protein/uncharacterized alpha-E superfamily protein